VGLFFLNIFSKQRYGHFSSLNPGETTTGKDNPMARKPNYSFEKRQKELAKKAKKEEKNKRKQEEAEAEAGNPLTGEALPGDVSTED
jgi:hypothetical protein